MNFITKLRQLNRKRNVLKKELKYNFRLYMASRRWKDKKFTTIHPDQIKTILLIRNEGKIGDAIVSTCFLSELYKAGYAVDILAVKGDEIIFSNNPHVRNVYLSEALLNKSDFG